MNRAERRKYAKKYNTPQKLENFSKNFDREIRKEYDKLYEKKYQIEVEETIDNFIIAIMYALHFSETTKMENDKLKEFMEDLLVTVEMFKRGEFSPQEYRETLEKDGIKIISSKNGEEE